MRTSLLNTLSLFILFLASTSFAFGGLEKKIFEEINHYRKTQGKPALGWDPHLSTMALHHSQNMAQDQKKFGHAGFHTRFQQARTQKPEIQSIAENVSQDYPRKDTPQQIINRWSQSSQHNRNMLGPFQMGGVGVATSSQGKIFVTFIGAQLKQSSSSTKEPHPTYSSKGYRM